MITSLHFRKRITTYLHKNVYYVKHCFYYYKNVFIYNNFLVAILRFEKKQGKSASLSIYTVSNVYTPQFMTYI